MTQYILISGASSGIGKAAAEALAESGFTVFAGALNDAEAQMLRDGGRKNIVPVVLDVTSTDSIDAAMRQISGVMGGAGRLHGLVSCAGVDINAPLHILNTGEIRQMVGVNYLGGIFLTRAALPLLQHGSGRIVFISSAMALIPTPTISIYCSTKTGIEGFADALRVELIPVGIKVAIIEPGVIRTPMVKAGPQVLEQMLQRMSADDRARYEAMMRKIVHMSSDPKAGITTDHTTKAISAAISAATPKIRYRVGADSKAAGIISGLPDGVRDWIQRKIYSI